MALPVGHLTRPKELMVERAWTHYIAWRLLLHALVQLHGTLSKIEVGWSRKQRWQKS